MTTKAPMALALGLVACVTSAPKTTTTKAVPKPVAARPSAADEAAAADAGKRWVALCDQHKMAELRPLCEPWLTAPNRLLVAEGHKCLANFELAGASTVRVEGDKSGGVLGPGYAGPGVDAALAHLDAGIAASPDDLSIHQGRLHVLESSGHADRMSTALEQSLTVYKGPDALDAWLAYSAELEDARQLESGAAYLRTLMKRYPNDHGVVGNLGAFLQELGRNDEALALLRRAVELAPDDAYDNWNLGQALAKGDPASAEASLRRGLAHARDEDKADMTCKLGHFLETERDNPPEACALERQACEKKDRAACKGARRR
jgi:Flp pilus assembly protein TadD